MSIHRQTIKNLLYNKKTKFEELPGYPGRLINTRYKVMKSDRQPNDQIHPISFCGVAQTSFDDQTFPI